MWPLHPFVAQARESVRFAAAGGAMSTPEQLIGFAQRVEERGFDACWYNDHPMRLLDCWSILSAVAVSTRRIRIFPLVSCIGYRSAAQTARAAADVDRLSHGRLILGIGIGDDEGEFTRLGLAYPPARVRQAALESYLGEIADYWKEGGFRFGPVQEGGIPILIAGGGERVTLAQVSRLGHMSNFGPHEWAGGAYGVEGVTRKLDALRRHCEAIGRPYETVLRSHYSPLVVLSENPDRLADKAASIARPPNEYFVDLVATPDDAVRHYQGLVDVGMQYFLANTSAADEETLDLLAEKVLPRVGLG